jgi:hypothetical protein
METINENSYIVEFPSTAAQTHDVKVHGIILKRTFRSSYASLLVAVVNHSTDYYPPDEEEDRLVLVRLQFKDNKSALRSHCKRFCKMGDRLQVLEGTWQTVSDMHQTDWEDQRLVVDLESTDHAIEVLKILETFCWTIKQCQAWQQLTVVHSEDNEIISPFKGFHKSISSSSPENSDEATGHGTIAGKHKQVEYLTNFLIGMMIYKLKGGTYTASSDAWSTQTYLPCDPVQVEAIAALSERQGVLDVAGGIGHLSMALGMAGIRSTVIDPRPSVGLLNKRDRKMFRKALCVSKELSMSGEYRYCLPVQEFQIFRGWFGQPALGVDFSFRHPDDNPDDVQALTPDHQLLKDCTSIVALHPDEATEAIVDTAVANRIPFCIVPCCVFCRLYPHRQHNGKLVSTYDDLLDYLQAKDPSIQRSSLPFYGKNIVLWSTFS